MNCKHKRIKKNYPFGRKSTARKVCKDCGAVISNKFIQKRHEERNKERKK